jgi:hypothetical protein
MGMLILNSVAITLIVIVSDIVLIIVAATTASLWLLSTNNAGPPAIPDSCPSVNTCNIAFIKPTFTAAAYHHSFYKFYFVYASITHARAYEIIYTLIMSYQYVPVFMCLFLGRFILLR